MKNFSILFFRTETISLDEKIIYLYTYFCIQDKDNSSYNLCLPNIVVEKLQRLHKRKSGADAIKKIYSQLRNSLFRSLDFQIGVRSKICGQLVTHKSGFINFLEIGVWTTKKFIAFNSQNFLTFYDLGVQTPKLEVQKY